MHGGVAFRVRSGPALWSSGPPSTGEPRVEPHWPGASGLDCSRCRHLCQGLRWCRAPEPGPRPVGGLPPRLLWGPRGRISGLVHRPLTFSELRGAATAAWSLIRAGQGKWPTLSCPSGNLHNVSLLQTRKPSLGRWVLPQGLELTLGMALCPRLCSAPLLREHRGYLSPWDPRLPRGP